MAQYDVFPNPSSSAAAGIPCVVVIQSDLLDGLATRLTIPLAAQASALVSAMDAVRSGPVALIVCGQEGREAGRERQSDRRDFA